MLVFYYLARILQLIFCQHCYIFVYCFTFFTIHLYAYTPNHANIPNVPKNTPTISSRNNTPADIIIKENKTKTETIIENPNTGDNIIHYILLLFISLGAIIHLSKKIRA